MDPRQQQMNQQRIMQQHQQQPMQLQRPMQQQNGSFNQHAQQQQPYAMSPNNNNNSNPFGNSSASSNNPFGSPMHSASAFNNQMTFNNPQQQQQMMWQQQQQQQQNQQHQQAPIMPQQATASSSHDIDSFDPFRKATAQAAPVPAGFPPPPIAIAPATMSATTSPMGNHNHNSTTNPFVNARSAPTTPAVAARAAPQQQAVSAIPDKYVRAATNIATRGLVSKEQHATLLKVMQGGITTDLDNALIAVGRGEMAPLNAILYNARWTTGASASTLKKTVTEDSDEDDDDDDDGNASDGTMSTISGGDDDDEAGKSGGRGTSPSAGAAGGGVKASDFKAPNPYAGGFTGVIPSELRIERNGTVFCGPALFRVSSKKLFRKWKEVFVVLSIDHIRVFDSFNVYKTKGVARMVVPLHFLQMVEKPSLKKTYSIMDDGRQIFFATLGWNDLAAVDQAVKSGRAPPRKYSKHLKTTIVCKFGSLSSHAISAWAHAILSCIVVKQREHDAQMAAGGRGGGASASGASGSFRASGRYA